MDATNHILGTLAVALLLSKVLGHVFDRVKLPPILGQVLAGMLMVNVSPYFSDAIHSEFFTTLSDMGLMMLLFVTGTESSRQQIKEAGVPSTAVAFLGAAGPFALGYFTARYLGLTTPQSLAVGAMLAPTSIGITAITLLGAQKMRTRVGATLVGAAILDDFLVMFLVVMVFGVGTLGGTALNLAMFLVAAVMIGWLLVPRLFTLLHSTQIPEAPLSLSLSLAFGLAAIAQLMGIAAASGAFIAGLAVSEKVSERFLESKIRAIAYGLFIPIFFVRTGAVVSFDNIGGVLVLAPWILGVGIVGKFGGAFCGALVGRLNWREAVQTGVGMLPRMEISLVVVALAGKQSIFTGAMLDKATTIALMNTVVSLLITPILLRMAFNLEKSAPG